MNLIQSISLLSERPVPDWEWRDEWSYSQSQRKRKAIFMNPFEFAMGGYAWDLKIVNSETGKNEIHRLIEEINGNGGFWHLHQYQPWVGMGSILIFNGRKGLLGLYDCERKKEYIISRSAGAYSLIGCKYLNRAVLSERKGTYLIDEKGQLISKTTISHEKNENPELAWIPQSRVFFAVFRPSEQCPTKIVFFDGQSGCELSSQEIDPEEFVPYDKEKYQKIGRDNYSLSIGRGVRCVGRFLDIWSRMEYDEEVHRILLRVYRPQGKLYCEERNNVVEADETWIEIKINVQQCVEFEKV